MTVTTLLRKIKSNLETVLPHVVVHLGKRENWVYGSTELNSRQRPNTLPGSPDVCGIAVAIGVVNDELRLRFVEITSSQKGMGETMAQKVLEALPHGTTISLVDFAPGFWSKIRQRYPDYNWI